MKNLSINTKLLGMASVCLISGLCLKKINPYIGFAVFTSSFIFLERYSYLVKHYK